MMPLVRIQARDVEGPNDSSLQMLIDVFIDNKGVVRPFAPTFGCVGTLSAKPERFYPFALRQDGRLLNPHDANDPDVLDERLNIFGKAAEVGEYFTLSNGETDVNTYRITKVTSFQDMEK